MDFKSLQIFICSFLASTLFTGCQKQSNLHTEHWIANEAGAYTINSVTYTKYSNDQMLEQKEIFSGPGTFVLKSIEAEGATCYQLDIYGNYLPDFLNHVNFGYAWTTEYDNKRMTFGYLDPSIGYVPAATLSVDNIGKQNQIWNYVQAYTQGGNDIYIRYEYKVSRAN